MEKTWQEVSTTQWPSKKQPNGHYDIDLVNMACLQRIAAATELMAKNHAILLDERDRYFRWYKEEQSKKEALERSNRSLRGTITRLKNKSK